MNQDRNQEEHPCDLSAAGAGRISRRGLLARLAALPVALGLAVFVERDSAGAKDGKKQQRKQRGGGNKNKKGNGGGDGDNSGGGGGGDEEQAFLKLINDYRRKSGAGSLSRQNQLDAAAQHHSDDMAKKNYFSHRLSNGDSSEENIERHGYRNWRYIGENIAAGDETAKQVFARWKNSSSHDKNMRNKTFTEIGIGRAYDKSSKYGWYWTTTFGSR